MSTTGARSDQGVAAFLAITFGLTWLPFAPALLGGPAVPLLMPFAPAIGCYVVRRWVTKEGFSDLGLRVDLRRTWPVLAVALLWPLATMPLALLIATTSGIPSAGPKAVEAAAVVTWTVLSVLAAPVFLGEELGWRGFLQPRVCHGRPLRAAAVTGVLWGVWHYPLWLWMPGMPLWMLPLMTVSLVVASVFFGWLQAQSGSVWAPALAHSTNNTLEANAGFTVFAGRTGLTSLPVAPSLTIAVAEAMVLLGLVAVATAQGRRYSGEQHEPYGRVQP